jgi:hypothetical protein
MKIFKICDKVKWTSQAQGCSKTKYGEIVQILAAGERPARDAFPDLYKGLGCGFGRTVTSYVVRVKNKHYWPISSKLERV